jgi:hypothetical protein
MFGRDSAAAGRTSSPPAKSSKRDATTRAWAPPFFAATPVLAKVWRTEPRVREASDGVAKDVPPIWKRELFAFALFVAE